jgi:hypothetical protein
MNGSSLSQHYYFTTILHECSATKSLIDGRQIITDAERMRDFNSIECGPEAKLFEPLDVT